MSRDPKKRAEAIRLLARSELADRRRRTPVRTVVLVCALVLLAAAVGWWLWPRPALPPLIVVAFDQVALPQENVRLCARVGPVDGQSTTANLAGCELYFQEVATDLLTKLQTNHAGQASTESRFPARDQAFELIVRYPGEDRRRRGSQASARIFVWPRSTRLLLVDADHALAEGDEENLWAVNNLDLRPRPGAAAALQSAQLRYHVVYVSAGADRPARYAKLRAWLERGWAPAQEQFPPGPVLAYGCQPNEAELDTFLFDMSKSLRKRFQEPLLAVAGRPEEAEAFRRADLQTYLVGQGSGGPEGVHAFSSWSELAKSLLK
jgi:hypothetical protein